MEELKRCSTCGDPITIGFLMPNGDYVCADYSCCYEYCKITGERVEIAEITRVVKIWEEESE